MPELMATALVHLSRQAVKDRSKNADGQVQPGIS